MISIVIPTLNAEQTLSATLAALIPAAVDGLIGEVIIADGGSTDATARIADDAGAKFIACERGRGQQLGSGAAHTKSSWLLFLHADTVLCATWQDDARRFMHDVETAARQPAAAAFRFALDDTGLAPRLLERLVALRCQLFKLPYGDQGLLIQRSLYQDIGGYRPLQLMEDIDIVRRLGRARMVLLASQATTSAQRYRNSGYCSRTARNLSCIALFYLRVPSHHIARLYD